MKKLFLILFVLITSRGFAQKKEDLMKFESFKVNSANSLKVDTINRTITFIGNVDFESKKLKIKANEIFLDQKTNKIVVQGMKDMNFDGKVVFAKEPKKHVLTYTIGTDTVLVE